MSACANCGAEDRTIYIVKRDKKGEFRLCRKCAKDWAEEREERARKVGNSRLAVFGSAYDFRDRARARLLIPTGPESWRIRVGNFACAWVGG